MDNTKTLKAISGKGTAAKGSAASNWLAKLKNIPGAEALRRGIKATKPKQVVDITIFAVGIYLMYKFGQTVAQTIDSQMPSEDNMKDMLRQMQGSPGMMMPPPPM